MRDKYKEVIDALMAEGFHQLSESKELADKDMAYKITPYSLNEKLSFKFENLNHFVEFLNLADGDAPGVKIEMLQATLLELGLDPDKSFFVNFFERDPNVQQ